MYQCPNCKNAEPEIKITHPVQCETYINGQGDVWEYEVGDLRWDDATQAECVDCGHVGTVKDMTIEETETVTQNC